MWKSGGIITINILYYFDNLKNILMISMGLEFLVGMVKQPAMEPSEFTMSNEDFPALPGVPASSAAAALNSTSAIGQGTNSIGDAVS